MAARKLLRFTYCDMNTADPIKSIPLSQSLSSPTPPSDSCRLDQEMDPATVFGIVTGAFQLAQQINQFKNRILAKSNDPKELRTLQKEAKVYIKRLQECEDKMGEDAKLAPIELRTVLEDIVKEIEALKKRKTVTKILTSLRIYSPELEKRMVTSLRSFHVKLSIESQKYSEILRDSMTEQMKQLHITKTQLEALSAEQNVMSQHVKATMTEVDCRMGKIEANMEHIKSHQLQMQELLRSLSNEGNLNSIGSAYNQKLPGRTVVQPMIALVVLAPKSFPRLIPLPGSATKKLILNHP